MTDKKPDLNICAVTNLDEFRRKQPELVYQCTCGSQHFYLVYNPNSPGPVQCRECDMFQPEFIWGRDAGTIT